eukprot:2526079-Prymnesium_polylepis.1
MPSRYPTDSHSGLRRVASRHSRRRPTRIRDALADEPKPIEASAAEDSSSPPTVFACRASKPRPAASPCFPS